ncbi:MAG: hypothetical protein ABMA26_11105 [Limisphaerales bacterium]
MKLPKLVSVLTVAVFAVLSHATASAAEPLLSPRAKSAAMVRIAGTEADHLDRSLPTASPKARALQASLARISGSEADHLERGLPTVSPKVRSLR